MKEMPTSGDAVAGRVVEGLQYLHRELVIVCTIEQYVEGVEGVTRGSGAWLEGAVAGQCD